MHTAKAMCGEANAMKSAAKKEKAFTKKAAICANILCTGCAAFAAAPIVTFPQSTRIHHLDFFLRHLGYARTRLLLLGCYALTPSFSCSKCIGFELTHEQSILSFLFLSYQVREDLAGRSLVVFAWALLQEHFDILEPDEVALLASQRC